MGLIKMPEIVFLMQPIGFVNVEIKATNISTVKTAHLSDKSKQFIY